MSHDPTSTPDGSMARPTRRVRNIETIDWTGLTKGAPLEFLLEAAISVYYKIDRAKYIAYWKRYVPVPKSAKPVGAKLLNEQKLWAIKGFDGDLLLLRLDDAPLRELILTGAAHVETFIAGGLAAPDMTYVTGNPKELCLIEQDFVECSLISIKKWRASTVTATPLDCADSFIITSSDLYVESEDVDSAAAGIRPASRLGRVQAPLEAEDLLEPYPASPKGNPPPAHMLWLYRAALNFNSRGHADKKEIAAWLRETPDEKLFHKTSMSTAKWLVPVDYRLIDNLKKERLDHYPNANLLRNSHVGLGLHLAMAIASWWVDLESRDEDARTQLAERLTDAGFLNTAVIDLMGFITGTPVSYKLKSSLIDFVEKHRRKKLAFATPKKAPSAS